MNSKDVIHAFRIYLVPDTTFRNIAVFVSVSDRAARDHVRIRLPELHIDQSLPLTDGQAVGVLKAQPVLWSPTYPKLHDVNVSFREDRVDERVGFREIRVKSTQILLNGEPIVLRGIPVQADDLRSGSLADQKEIQQWFRQVKQSGCNFIRLPYSPQQHFVATLADEAGLLVWEEILIYWANTVEQPSTYQDAGHQLVELIGRDFNRASVFVWSVGFEYTDTEAGLMRAVQLADKLRQADPSRLVSTAFLTTPQSFTIKDRRIAATDIIALDAWEQPADELLNLPGSPTDPVTKPSPFLALLSG